MIAIIDYGAGNLRSVKNALDCLQVDSRITNKATDILKADRLILPGDGSFGFMMDSLRKNKLEAPIKKSIQNGKPFLGICLGLQALFEESEENSNVKGFCIFKGKVVRFRKGKVPQIGWNNIISKKKGIFRDGYVYFVNSYYVVPEDRSIVATTTDYYGNFVSSIKQDNITAMQFHPEKSGDFGIELLRRWLKC
ncbi:imidazole glycerol phosphate synthase subunit HisH [Candidatus Woesearchaeota archaeon]|jgi:imidazole glycerol phosphate synthase glutamine amidotransferase subunit|nr:imidazole glycerol phosphate synthase subunit HisH [Candidatus Woesearchaeota archaeon]|tara:strand:- start:3206 stop:3787 length:582 start_codon:yes stop_codon:yes gene_type:complete